MVYQVLKWSRNLDGWVPLPGPIAQAHAARLQLSQTRRYCADAVLVKANTLSELACQVRQVQQSLSRPAGAARPVTVGAPLAHADPKTALFDDRRWELECGPGGDHDEPYRFELPVEAAVRYRWLRLLAHVNRRVGMEECVGGMTAE